MPDTLVTGHVTIAQDAQTPTYLLKVRRATPSQSRLFIQQGPDIAGVLRDGYLAKLGYSSWVVHCVKF